MVVCTLGKTAGYDPVKHYTARDIIGLLFGTGGTSFSCFPFSLFFFFFFRLVCGPDFGSVWLAPGGGGLAN